MPFTRREALLPTGAIAIAGALPACTKASLQDAGACPQAAPAASTGPVCLTDFEPLAKAKMSHMGWEYINSGTGDELTMQWNREAYQRIRLKPHVLTDVSSLDTRITESAGGDGRAQGACPGRHRSADRPALSVWLGRRRRGRRDASH